MENAEILRELLSPSTIYTRKCPICDDQFRTPKPEKKFCSRICRIRSNPPPKGQVYYRTCTICSGVFETTIRAKNICSFACRREHNRQHARFYTRRNRSKLESGRSGKCTVCGFSETTDMHREGGKVYVLCPNHHCLITRGIKTLEEILALGKEKTAI